MRPDPEVLKLANRYFEALRESTDRDTFFRALLLAVLDQRLTEHRIAGSEGLAEVVDAVEAVSKQLDTLQTQGLPVEDVYR